MSIPCASSVVHTSDLIRFGDRSGFPWRGSRLSRLRLSVSAFILCFSVAPRFPFLVSFVAIPGVNLRKVEALASVDSAITVGFSVVLFRSFVSRHRFSASAVSL